MRGSDGSFCTPEAAIPSAALSPLGERGLASLDGAAPSGAVWSEKEVPHAIDFEAAKSIAMCFFTVLQRSIDRASTYRVLRQLTFGARCFVYTLGAR